MKNMNILILSAGLLSLSAGMNSVLSQDDRAKHSANPAPHDAVEDAQTVHRVPVTRPEQKKDEHDRSSIFDAKNAMPSSPAFANHNFSSPSESLIVPSLPKI